MSSFTEAQAMYSWTERIRDEKLPAVSYIAMSSQLAYSDVYILNGICCCIECCHLTCKHVIKVLIMCTMHILHNNTVHYIENCSWIL